jgi:hypothetical protein
MKQTAVEWLTEKLRIEFGFAFSNNILDKAKEMQKQQIIDAHSDWTRVIDNLPSRTAEQYYNETFKSE